MNGIFSKLSSWFSADPKDESLSNLDPLEFAAAVLMYEVANVDGTIGDDEEECIIKILASEFELTIETTNELCEAARARAVSSVQILPAIRPIKDNYDEPQKEHLFELLWSIVLIDRNRAVEESTMMRRLAGLLYLSDKASGRARQRALQKLENT
jgi:uncharacterized tellurite resistance protein B-like protein